MTVSEAQREVREVFLNGAVGQAVSGVLWLAAAAVGVWGGHGPVMGRGPELGSVSSGSVRIARSARGVAWIPGGSPP